MYSPEYLGIKDVLIAGGMLSGKAGIVNGHLGDDVQMLDLLEEVVRKTPLPVHHFLPTHMNRNLELFERGIAYAKNGGHVDFTTMSAAALKSCSDIKCSKALRRMLDEGVPIEQITFSSDGQGSIPIFDEKGVVQKYRVPLWGTGDFDGKVGVLNYMFEGLVSGDKWGSAVV